MWDCTSNDVGLYLVLCRIVPHFKWECTSFYVGLYLILCGIVSHVMWDCTSCFAGLYLILCGIVPHIIWDCTSYYVGLYLILCGIVSHVMWDCTSCYAGLYLILCGIVIHIMYDCTYHHWSINMYSYKSSQLYVAITMRIWVSWWDLLIYPNIFVKMFLKGFSSVIQTGPCHTTGSSHRHWQHTIYHFLQYGWELQCINLHYRFHPIKNI